ncbi:MAG: prepilin-type N-terminal cleavage/methylation domain-containing protein [Bdellovibrionales bacterium]|nr:prepilin-type N-terminal cleavage/methylation domain-containing protein [Bdellovibrionales bacterium]
MRQNNKGMTLIEVLVGIALVSILFVAVAEMIGYFTKTTQTFRRSVVRDSIQQNVARFSNLPQQLRNSITITGPYTITGLASSYADNDALRKCIQPGGADCTDNTWVGFTLLQGAPGSTMPQAGPSSTNPVRYTSEGGKCDTASPTCPIRVYVEFMAHCPGNPPPPAAAITCDAASNLDIKYTIDQDPGVNLNPPIRTVTNAPGSPNAEPMLSVAIPLASQFNGAKVNSLSFWSSTTDLATSNIYQDTGTGNVEILPTSGTFTPGNARTLLAVDGAIRPGSGAGEACNNTIIGAIRVDNTTDSLQLCTLDSIGSYSWKWIAGASAPAPSNGGSGGSGAGSNKYPYLPNLYLCPVGGSAPCGGLPPCVGQVSNYSACCLGVSAQTCYEFR